MLDSNVNKGISHIKNLIKKVLLDSHVPQRYVGL